MPNRAYGFKSRPRYQYSERKTLKSVFFLSMENPQLGWGFRKAFSFKPVIKTPFDLLKHLAVWQLQKFNKKSKLVADKFLQPQTLGILLLGVIAFGIGTAAGVLMAKLMNLCSKNKINPLIGSAGVSALLGRGW